jgi:hypothetical protein
MTTGCSGSLKDWRGLRGTGQLMMGGSRGRSSWEKGIGRRNGSKTGGTVVASGAGVDNMQRGAVGVSCAVRLGKKWCEEAKG